MKFSFTANILAEVKDTPKIIKGGLSISAVAAKMARGEFNVELPQFISEPTFLLKDKEIKNEN